MSYIMTTFEGGPVKQFDNLKIKTPEQLQAEQKAIDIAEQQRKQAEKSTSDIKNAAALDAVIDGYQADQAIANIPDDPNNPNFGKEGNKFDITNNNEKNLQYLKDNPRAVDDIKTKMEFMKNELAKKNDKLGDIPNSVSQKAVGFLDGFKTLFDSPLAGEFKAIFYNMMALFGKEEDKNKYATEAAFSEAEQKVSKLNKEEKVIDKAGNELTYIRALKLLTLGKNDENMQDMKRRFAGAGIDQQKAYIAAAIKDPTNTDLLNILGEKVDKPSETKEQEKNPNIIKVKGLDDKNPDSENSVELKGEGDNQYALIDGNIFPIKNNKISYFSSLGEGLSFVKKEIIINPDKTISLVDGNQIKFENTTRIIERLKEPDIFDFWKINKINSLIPSTITLPETNTSEIQKIILDLNQHLDDLPIEDRTEEKLKNIITETDKKVLSFIPEFNKSEVITYQQKNNTNIAYLGS
ncbi:hypothetical protein XF24_00158 [candidate division SR1 bacterium Aalborg_AAW-1]|nr:hypothetical protein XF24_00158 [candidate division SR1 bacterium Aalborg_AAW-1]